MWTVDFGSREARAIGRIRHASRMSDREGEGEDRSDPGEEGEVTDVASGERGTPPARLSWKGRRVRLDSALRWWSREAVVVFDRQDGYLTIRRDGRQKTERWHQSHFELIPDGRVVA
jgi:hypothetical protein